MISIAQFSQKTLKKYGIENQQGFYFIVLIAGILSCISSFIGTYVNLDIHQLLLFKNLVSWDFTMPCLGALLGTLFFPKARERLASKNIMRISFMILFISFGLMIFLINTYYDFLLRFIIGFFFLFFFLELACFQAETFQAPYRATFFSIMGIEVGLASALGSSLVDVIHSSAEVFEFCMGGIFICFILTFLYKKAFIDKKKTVNQSAKGSEQPFYKTVFIFPFIFIAIFTEGSMGGGIHNYLPIFFENLGLSKGSAAFSYSLTGLGSLFLMPIAGRMGDKLGYEKSFFLTTLLGLLLASITFFVKQTALLSFLFFLIRGVHASFMCLMYGWFAVKCPGKNLSYGMASFSLIKHLSYVFAPLGVGALMGTYGNKGLLLWCWGTVGITFMLIFFQAQKSSL